MRSAQAKGTAALNELGDPITAESSSARHDPVLRASLQKPMASPQPVEITRQYELVELVEAYDPLVDGDLLNKAYVFSTQAHGGQTRKSGDPYFTHPLAVARILTDLKVDPASVVTALLHDVVEDTPTTIEDIRHAFNDEIARLVDGVTKLSKFELKSEESKTAENFGKLILAMSEDVRVVLVKLADRLHNMRTLHHFDNAEKRRRIALETMEIYAPLAGRMGVYKIRDELEDRAFAEISPQVLASICERLDQLRSISGEAVADVSYNLKEKLANAGIDAEVSSREKRPFSIWRKMSKKNLHFDEIADIFGFRIIVASEEDCYRALGVVHTNWRMVEGEFDDYISATKSNGYSSIHTCVFGKPTAAGGRQRIEVQIRTREMHETAERGVAAHWRYKDQRNTKTGIEFKLPGMQDPYETPRRLVAMFEQGEDPNEALEYAKLELFQDQVFCFTPKGGVIALPKGATALDFAYAVHTNIGDSCVGVKVNGVARPLRTPLNNGDVVLILRSENAPPPAGWESMVITGRARSAIRRRIKRMKYTELVELGRARVESLFANEPLEITEKAVRASLPRLGEKSTEEVFAKVGRGDLSANAFLEAVYPGASLQSEGKIRAAGMAAFLPRNVIEGLPPGELLSMGNCCWPLPGERIVGIRGAEETVIHAIHCEALAIADPPQSQWIDLQWRNTADVTAYGRAIVTVRNEIGVLSDVAGVIARYGVSIANIRLQNQSPDFVDLEIDMVVKNARQMSQMLTGIRALASVVRAKRVEERSHGDR